MAQTDDTAARSDAWHEANDHTERVNEAEPAEASMREYRNGRGESPDAEARRIEHERKNTNADGSLVPVEDRRPREVPFA